MKTTLKDKSTPCTLMLSGKAGEIKNLNAAPYRLVLRCSRKSKKTYREAQAVRDRM